MRRQGGSSTDELIADRLRTVLAAARGESWSAPRAGVGVDREARSAGIGPAGVGPAEVESVQLAGRDRAPRDATAWDPVVGELPAALDRPAWDSASADPVLADTVELPAVRAAEDRARHRAGAAEESTAEPAVPAVSAEPDAPAEPEGSRQRRHRLVPRGGATALRWDAGRPGVLALCAAAAIGALLAAVIAWWTAPESVPVSTVGDPAATALELSGESTPGSAAASGAAEGSAEAPPTQTLVVSVIGLVVTPGLVSVPDGARVADVIRAAGGALPEADLSTVNLARVVVDGEQIAVGIPGVGPPEGPSPPDSGADSGSGALLDLNAADPAALEELPGIGPVLAQRIVDHREEVGGFSSVEELREVSGIGPAVYADIVDLVTV